ncbi:hypothetical protein [Coleofasciculus sp. G2-EDA-02]|uniref:hypothetical protein n=1 Tax=Coleofasciculus sp. G2-EDA-02 TaxID=3069529 RepID=UPI0033055127
MTAYTKAEGNTPKAIVGWARLVKNSIKPDDSSRLLHSIIINPRTGLLHRAVLSILVFVAGLMSKLKASLCNRRRASGIAQRLRQDIQLRLL